MKEGFSTPESYSKKMGRREIEEGLMEYLSSPKSKEGLHPELADSFEAETTPEPLRRKDIEKEIEGFVDKNFEKVLPILLSGRLSHGELIKKLGITNEQIGLLGANYYIRTENGEPAIYQADEYNPEGRKISIDEYGEVSTSDLLALAYVKDAVRVDTQNEAERMGSKISHRYFLQSQNRYLCANDFGMRVWDEEEGRMAQGKADNVASFVNTVKHQLARIQENLNSVAYEQDRKIREEVSQEIPLPNYNDYENSDEYYAESSRCEQQIEQTVSKRVAQALSEQFTKNPGDKKLVLEAVPAQIGRAHV